MSGTGADKARRDVSAVCVWGTHERTFIAVKIFHPNCPSYINMEKEKAYVQQENIKKRKYKEKILNVECGLLTPILFSTTGGAGPEADRHLKRVTELMALKKKGEYSQIITFIRTRLHFNLLRSILVWRYEVKEAGG